MTIADRLRDNKAVYTVAGAGDLAVAKLREMPEQVVRIRATVNEQMTRYQEKVEVKDLPGAAVSYMTHFGARTVEVIDGLAERGKKVVARTDNEERLERTEETKAAVIEAKKVGN
jgi:hypothetical protein